MHRRRGVNRAGVTAELLTARRPQHLFSACGASLHSQADKAAKADAASEAKIVKMLLLGAGESGKSTIFKQMKIINKDGYSETERKTFVGIVHSNTISSMKTLMEAFEKLEMEMDADLKVSHSHSCRVVCWVLRICVAEGRARACVCGSADAGARGKSQE